MLNRILTIVLFSLPVLIFGQSKKIHNTGPITSNEPMEYLVIQDARLQPGFSFKASGGNTLIIRMFQQEKLTDPSPAQNFTRVETIQVPGIKTEAAVNALNHPGRQVSYEYHDELGRTSQSIAVRAIGTRDMVQPQVYDNLGRQPTSYLPYSLANEGGQFRPNAINEQASFYNNASLTVTNDSRPFSTSQFEPSPLSRVTSVNPPGDDLLNRTNDNVMKVVTTASVRRWKISGDNPVTTSAYPANTVSYIETTDANGNRVRSYTSPEGYAILREVEVSAGTWYKNYTVFDGFGKTRFVIPPEAVSLLEGNGWNMTPAILQDYCFIYTYDERQRLVEQKSPGIAPEYFVYDRWDRLVLSQNGTQRTSNQWDFAKYDEFNRLVITGIHTQAGTRDDLVAAVNAVAGRFEIRNTSATGYTLNRTFPLNPAVNRLMAITYYDDYGFVTNAGWDAEGNSYSYSLVTGFTGTRAAGVLGMPTGGKVKVLDGSNKWLNSVTYYDDRYRPLQTIAEHHLGGKEVVTSQYQTITGWVDKTYWSLSATTGSVSVLDEYAYDPQGRLLDMYQTIDGGMRTLLASHKYNELGDLVEKNLHSTNNGATFLQSVDYRYNVRGALTHINNSTLTNDGVNNDDTNDLFGMEIMYTSPPATINANAIAPRYSGDITAIKWKTSTLQDLPVERIYGFNYDKLDQLKQARYGAGGGAWSSEGGYYDVEVPIYDKNGNIKALDRYALHGGTRELIDDLNYTYVNGNQLDKVEDVNGNAEGFHNRVSGVSDYEYYPDGSLKWDLNKDISLITYNDIHLPQKVDFYNGRSLEFTYDASGILLKKVLKEGSTPIKTTDYLAGVQYEDGAIAFLFTPEGRAIKTGPGYDYEYFLTDHLGNTRVAFGYMTQTDVYRATMETERAAQEDDQFNDILRNGIVNHTPADFEVTNPNESAQLHGLAAVNGPSKYLEVKSGDKVNLEVFANYTPYPGANSQVLASVLLSAVTGSFGITNTGETQSAYHAFDSHLPGHSAAITTTNGVPKAYIAYILFNEDYTANQFGFSSISNSAGSGFEKLTLEATVPYNGHLYIYVANETTTTGAATSFDDLLIIHRQNEKSLQVTQAVDYYPFGMPITGTYYQNEGMLANQYLYQGKELQSEEGLDWYDFHARQYDAALGRFLAVDPAGQFASPYNGMGNNPVMMIDPGGELAWFVPVIIGAVINTAANYQNIDNAWDALGYAAVGSLSGYVGGAISGANIAFSNTLAIAGASTLNSVGNYGVSGGKGNIYTSFGAFSMNWTQGDFGYLGEKGNSTLENIGYGLGFLANLNDVNNLIDQTKATLYTQEQYADGSKDIISHTGIVDDASGEKLMSFGPNDSKIGGGGFKDQIGNAKPGGGYKKFGLAVRKGTADYPVPVDLSKSTSVTANKYLFRGLKGFSKIVPYQGCTTNCVNMSSLGLWLNGIPNIGIHPYLLHYSMAAYNSGVRPELFSYYLQR